MLSHFYEQILKINKWQGRKFIEEVIMFLEKKWHDKNIFIIEAPTGYGKSAISQTVSLYSVSKELKSIVVFPLRTLLEDQYDKFKRITNTKILGKRYMHNADSRYLIKSITLTTIDTLSLTLFGIPPEDFDKVVRKWSGTGSGSLGHYLFSHSSILLSNIILDEVHLLSDSIKSLTFLVLLIKFAIDNGMKLILMSATIPSALEEKLLNCIGSENMEIIRFDSKNKNFYDERFVNERNKKKYKIFLHMVTDNEKYDKILSWIKNERLKKKIIIFNTIEDSVNLFNITRGYKEVENKILLHSRFNEVDREEKIKKLEEIKNDKEYLIISTQTIEAGIDVSSNLFVTEIAPAGSLIQRLGRFLRYEGENEGEVHIWYEVDGNGNLKSRGNKYKVYDWELTNRTIEFLKSMSSTFGNNAWESTSEKMNFHVPENYKNLLNFVYKMEDFKIDTGGIEDFLRIFLNMEKLSKRSLEKFIELEGSFVRDEMPVPVITYDILNQEKAESTVEQITRHVIPVSITQVSKLRPNEYLVAEKDDESKREILKRKPIKNSEKIFRFILKSSAIALIVNKKYDKEMGLLMDGIEND